MLQFADNKETQILEDFLVLQYYLARQLAGRNRKAIDHGASSRILAFISHRILPGNQFAGNSPFESGEFRNHNHFHLLAILTDYDHT